MKRITIYDVAKEAGVSLATVSRVINSSDVVKKQTKEKVEAAIQHLGYKPNAIAQGLALQKTTIIGLIIPEASFTYTGMVINGLSDVAKIYGYNIMLHTITDGISDISSIVDVVIKSRVDGVIIYSDEITSESMALLNEYNIPIVVIGEKVSSNSVCSVYVDIENAIYELCKDYLKRDIKDIAILEDRRNRHSSLQLCAGARKAFEEYGLPFEGYTNIPKEERSSYRFLKNLFRDHRYQLIITNRDSQAMAVLNAARENGISIPDDMELVCAIDTKYNSMVRPEISAFSIPAYDLGAVSMRLMTKMLRKEGVEDKEKCLNYLFSARETTRNHE